MISKIKTISLIGLDGELIEVQTDIQGGLPSFEIVGLPDTSVRESKERIRSAIKNTGIDFPSRKILINLAPANSKKEGTSYDLPIAIGILIKLNEINVENLENTIFIGELSLDGKVNRIDGVLPMCIEALNLGIKRIILPKANLIEASVIKELEVIGVKSLREVIDYLNGVLKINKVTYNGFDKKTIIYEEDFSEVKGQENAKRALEIAAAGGHNCILIGNPGSGKTMLARRIPSILPELSFEETLEITKIHSIRGKINSNMGLILQRPFRNPHHTISSATIIGGGRIPKPGEVSLAHLGVLFLDELTEFNKRTLEVLRGPLEDRKVTISRLYSTIEYPCNFMLVASMNPCPCGFYGSLKKKCTCSLNMINKYLSKISGPLLDRIDLHIDVKPVEYKKLNSNKNNETSNIIRERVNKARDIQRYRYKTLNIFSNSELTPKLIERYCKIDDQSKYLLEKAFNKFDLSARAYTRILKVARTIADLDKKDNIEKEHLIEAIQYRSLDKRYGDKIL